LEGAKLFHKEKAPHCGAFSLPLNDKTIKHETGASRIAKHMNSFSISTLPAKTWLILVLLVYTAFWLMYPQEFIASDPNAYSSRAFAISQNLDFGSNDVFNHRLGITLPVAFFYSILGVNILTTNLWPLLAALLIIVIVWLSLPDKQSRIIGAVLCLTSIPLFESSIALYPDIIAAAFMAASSLVLFNRKKFIATSKAWLLTPIAAVSLLFIAFLAKESAYWVLPLWILALLSDLRDEDKNVLLRQFHLPAILTGVFLGVTYLVFCDITWSDPLARFHSIQALTGQHLWSWNKAPAGELAKRLTTAPANLFLGQYGILILLSVTVGLAIAPRSIKPWRQYAICCLLFFWFGSTSFTRYEPMPLFDRMTLPILPAFYVLAAFAISSLSGIAEKVKGINKFVPILLLLIFAGLPFIWFVQSWRGVQLPEATAMAIVRNDLQHHPEKTYLLVCSDTRSPNSLLFYFGYKYPENLRVVFAGDLTDDLLNKDLSLVYIDRRRSAFLKAAYGRRHYDDEIDALNLTPVYKLGEIELLRSAEASTLKKIMASSNSPDNKN
jgi:hypothetical protein